VEPTQISEELSNEFGTAVEAKVFGDDDQLKLTTKYKIKEESADVDKEVNEKLFRVLGKHYTNMTYDKFINSYDGKN